ncbi:MAG: hypothetical protein WC421_07110 [Elusimicrobiales bacterium]
MLKIALCSALFFIAPGGASAQLLVKETKWQVAFAPKTAGKTAYSDSASVPVLKTGRLPVMLRLVVRVENSGAKPAEAVVLRCAFAMRLVREDSAEPGVWTVPFSIDERRVSKIPPGKTVEITVPHTELQVYLKRLVKTGFRPDRLRASVMLEPRRGGNLAAGMGEAEVEVKPL